MKESIAPVLLVFAGLTLSCHDMNEVVDQQLPRVSVTATNLQPLHGTEGHYQVWASFLQFAKSGGSDSPTHAGPFESLGEFNVVAGDPVLYGLDGLPARFTIPRDENAQLLDDVIITIGRVTDNTNDSLVGSIIMGGKFHGDANVALADLDVSYVDAFKSDFSSVTGKFTIMAPTSPADSSSGVWFVEKQGSTMSVGLRNLPSLPKGWTYEGWFGIYAVPESGHGFFSYVSTGKFLKADSADFDGAGSSAGSGAGLNFPGQDFISPSPVDLRSRIFMISIEPDPDNSATPFSLQLLSTSLPVQPLPSGQTLLMNNISSATSPRAQVKVVRSGY